MPRPTRHTAAASPHACLPLLLALLCGLPTTPTARADAGPPTTETASGPLTLELAMSDPDWIGAAPQNAYWSADGLSLYFERDPEGEDDDARLWRLDLATQQAAELTLEELGTTDTAGGDWSEDRRRRVYALHGDVFLRNVENDTLQQLTRTVATESQPFFLVGDRRVGFQRAGTWFVRDLDTGLESQPAEIETGDDPADEKPADDYLAQQQTRLFDVIRERRAVEERRRERENQRRRADHGSVPLPFYLGKGQEILGSSLSPGADAVLVFTAPEGRDEGRHDTMANWLTADGYVEVRDVRTKVGDGEDYTHSLVLLDLPAHEVKTIDLSGLPGMLDDPLADLKAAAEARAEAAKKAAAKAQAEAAPGASSDGSASPPKPAAQKKDGAKGKPGAQNESGQADDEAEPEEPKPRDVRIYQAEWSPDGSQVAVQVHSVDNKDRWLILVSREQPTPRLVHRLTRPGWINWDHNEFGWLPDGRLWFLSEATGFSHLYVHDPASATTTQLTRGNFVVADPQPDPRGTAFYVVANVDRPTAYDVYRVASQGGELERITDVGGLTSFSLSPEGQRLLLEHSSLLAPTELFLVDLDRTPLPSQAPLQLTHSTSAQFRAIAWNRPEVVPVPSTHQQRPVWSRYYAPKNPDLLRGADGTVPAVLFVHGAGYLQNAHEGWSDYFREMMFHTLLTEQGYAVLDMDYRGSKGYGADWREAIYRHMGQPELEDLLDGVAWLAAEHGVDPGRVGVYGGSYGGFMALMALFKSPGSFAAGAALRPVTDWAHYNHGYTSNILNTPEVDPEAYERSSPIEFAAGLADPLLVCAPMQDDNVFFQDTVRLSQKLIELGKTGWEVAIFPVEPHTFRRPSSWLDEYRRIHELFTRHLAPAAGP